MEHSCPQPLPEACGRAAPGLPFGPRCPEILHTDEDGGSESTIDFRWGHRGLEGGPGLQWSRTAEGQSWEGTRSATRTCLPHAAFGSLAAISACF